MTLDELKRETLKLPAADRARLACELLESFDPQQELDRLWLEEAVRRGAQIDSGEVELVTAEEVSRKVQALLR